jgi:hypothetical protein
MPAKRKSQRSWFKNFTYDSKHNHGRQEHFLGITMLKPFDGLVACEGGNFILAVAPGKTFHRCIYDPITRELDFYLDDTDTPPVQTMKCDCCNAMTSAEPLEEVVKPRGTVPSGNAAAGNVGTTEEMVVAAVSVETD